MGGNPRWGPGSCTLARGSPGWSTGRNQPQQDTQTLPTDQPGARCALSITVVVPPRHTDKGRKGAAPPLSPRAGTTLRLP